MNAVDIITKTKRKERLTKKEIDWLINGYVEGTIPDYQMSAWLMAVCFNPLSDTETLMLTEIMRDSGDKLDLSSIEGVTVDKHSTGGIGDKTSLIIAPICAVCGLKVPKMSGRGLGFTGGTIDKLESIDGFKVNVEFKDYVDIINKNGAAIIAQSGHLVPADKKLYALRDVTGTVDSIPLICSSIMSKKLATGADCLLLDVKCGTGAFMKNQDDARQLAELMVQVGKKADKLTRAMITDMNQPLGNAVGNALEVIEACNILSGKQKDRLYDLCIQLAANMLELGGKGSYEKCRLAAIEAVDSGKALQKLADIVEAQGGKKEMILDTSLFPTPVYSREVKTNCGGYICGINSEEIGMAALMTGAGRKSKEDTIDSSAGIILQKHVGDKIHSGDTIMTLYSSTVKDLTAAAERAAKAVELSAEIPNVRSVVLEVVQ